MSLRYLFDENVNIALVTHLRQRDPDLLTRFVGDPGAPRRGTADAEILRWCQEHDFVLVTNNRRTMPAHMAAHLQSGGHVPGIFQLNPAMPIGELSELLWIIAHASRQDEHRDQIRYLPML